MHLLSHPFTTARPRGLSPAVDFGWLLSAYDAYHADADDVDMYVPLEPHAPKLDARRQVKEGYASWQGGDNLLEGAVIGLADELNLPLLGA